MANSVQFQGSAESKGFQPIEQTTYIPRLKENHQAFMEAERTAGELKQQYASARRQVDNANWEALSKFSNTLSEYLVEETKKKNEQEEEAGLMDAFTNGIPEEAMRRFDEQEKMLSATDAQTRAVAGQVEQEGGSPFVAEQFRNLSGWRAYGFAKGMAMQAGTRYPAYYAEAADNVSVTINGQEVTMATAKDPAERAAVEAEIRRGFLRNFMGINPALLNKYLFPSMLQHESRAAIEWGEKRSRELKEQRQVEAQDELYTAISAGQGGAAVIDFINRRAGDFGGLGNARKAVREMLEAGIRSRQLDQGDIDAILNHEFVARDGRTVKLGEYWGREFGHLPDLLYEAGRVELQRDLQEQQDAKSQFQLLFEQQTAEKLSRGETWTEAELKAMADNWTAQGLGAPPDFILNHQSREDIEDKTAKETLMQLRQSRGYLTEDDLRGVSPELYQQMIGFVRADEDLAKPSEEVAKEATRYIEALVSETKQETDGTKDKSPEWHRIRANAVDAYAKYYREYIRSGRSPEEAHNAAIQRVEKNMKPPYNTYSAPPTSSVSQQNAQAQAAAMRALDANPRLIYDGVIPGSDAALAQARAYADTGRGELPLLYRQIASRTRGSTAWDIADAQLKASGHPGLLKPRVEQAVDQLDPTLRPLLTWRPTAARTNRVALQTGWKQFLDLIASEESAAYGNYDAMNTGGSHGGTVAYGSANSVNVFGRGLSSMTIGEVMNLHRQGRIHAAGRYQFIASTLSEVMSKQSYIDKHGLTVNDRFDQASQDKLAVSLAQTVMSITNNSLRGLRGTWIGLNKVSDATLRNAVNAITVQSPFNRPENIHPRLVYRIGSRGYGSTGPHLDVKPVRPGTTQTDRNLPPITKAELDQYVAVGHQQRPLSQGTVTTSTDQDHRRRARSSFGWDFAADDGTPVFLKNGARVVGTFKGDGGTDHTIIELPDGRRYQFLHGLNA